MILSTIEKKLKFLALGAGMKSQRGTNRIKPSPVTLPILYVALPGVGSSWPHSQQFHNWETWDTKPSPSLSHCSCLLQSLHNFGTLWALNCIPVINPLEHTLGEGKGTPKMCFSWGQTLFLRRRSFGSNSRNVEVVPMYNILLATTWRLYSSALPLAALALCMLLD